MRLLLDTHVVLWWLIEPERLSSVFDQAIHDANNTIFVSTASVWEVSIKKHLGKLVAPDDFVHAVHSSGFSLLPIFPEHAWLAGALPFHHYDPFDRLIAAHAKLENLSLLTVDPLFTHYDVALFSA